MPLHPLVLQAAAFFEPPGPVYSAFSVTDSDAHEGSYNFAIYAWEYKGLRPEIKLVPIFENEAIRENFFDYLEAGVALNPGEMTPDSIDSEQLDKHHYVLWSKEKELHQKRTQEICSYKLESLKTSHRGRLNVVEDQLASATNEKIQRMRRAQRDNIQADFDREIDELKMAETRADIYPRPVVFGLLKIARG